jgi:FkbM family methyltransferase
LLRIELPGPEVFFEPLPNDPTRVRAALWEFLSAHWFEVDLLDEYNTHRLLRPGMVVLDVGANVGTFAAVASRRVGSGGRVISVEPVTTNLECLSRTIEANGLANVEVLERAIGDENGTLEIFVSPTYSGRHSAVIKAGKPHSVRVRQSTVDALVAELRLEAIDFLKIDIEGYEVHALRGAVETIKRFRPIVAIAAYHDRAHPEMLSALMTESAQDCDVFLKRSPPLFPFVKCFGMPRERRV